jgi:hypothetical protein
MDHLTGLIRLLAEGGWRFGVPLALFGFAVIAAHRYDLPEPGAVAPYLGLATLVAVGGVAFTAVSVTTQLVAAAYTSIRSRLASKAYQRERDGELRANLQTLSFDELDSLAGILRSGRQRVVVSNLNDAWGLVQKGILRKVSGNPLEPICEVPALLLADKDELLVAIEMALRKDPRGVHSR